MHDDNTASEFFIDPRGHLVERIDVGGQDVVVHYRDIPESDITTIDGLRVTTALRTVIDLAPEVDGVELDFMVRHCLDRGLFTVAEAWARVAEPDMHGDPGARALRRLLSDLPRQ